MQGTNRNAWIDGGSRRTAPWCYRGRGPPGPPYPIESDWGEVFRETKCLFSRLVASKTDTRP